LLAAVWVRSSQLSLLSSPWPKRLGEAAFVEQQFAEALFEGEWNLPPDYLAWGQVGIPAGRTSLEGVASHLRSGGCISARVLMQFVWQGQRYDPMGQKLAEG